jgi:flagella basal body P-ring formation protein FlgA
MRRSLAFLSLLALLAGTLCAGAQAAVSAQQVVTGARLVEVAQKAVKGIVSGPDRELGIAYSVPDQQVPAGNLTIEALTPQSTPNYIAVPVAIEVDGKTVRTVMAGFRIISYIKTAIATRDLGFGEVLSESDVTVGRVAATGRPPVDAASLIGRQMNVQVARGAAVYPEQTRVHELVKAGQPVVYIIRDGNVMLSADVIARQSGALGTVVAVYNPSTKKEMSGVVTGPAQVEFVMPGTPEVLQ